MISSFSSAVLIPFYSEGDQSQLQRALKSVALQTNLPQSIYVIVNGPNEIIHKLFLCVHLPVLLCFLYLRVGAFDHSLELVYSFTDSVDKVVSVEEMQQCVVGFDVLMEFEVIFAEGFRIFFSC